MPYQKRASHKAEDGVSDIFSAALKVSNICRNFILNMCSTGAYSRLLSKYAKDNEYSSQFEYMFVMPFSYRYILHLISLL